MNNKEKMKQKMNGYFLKVAPFVILSSLTNPVNVTGTSKEEIPTAEENKVQNNINLAQILNESIFDTYEIIENERLSEEEIFQYVLGYCQTTDANFINLANHIVVSSQTTGYGYQNYMEVAQIFYEISQVPIEEKLNAVLMSEGITEEQFRVVTSVVSAEAKKSYGNVPCYIDSYGIINNIDSRTKCSRWILSAGPTLYHQVVARGQYVVYPKMSSRYLGDLTNGYLACIDFLYAEIYCKMHGLPLLAPERCLQFRNKERTGRIQYVPGGNNFFDILLPHENIDQYIPYVSPENYIKTLYYTMEPKFASSSNATRSDDTLTLQKQK